MLCRLHLHANLRARTIRTYLDAIHQCAHQRNPATAFFFFRRSAPTAAILNLNPHHRFFKPDAEMHCPGDVPVCVLDSVGDRFTNRRYYRKPVIVADTLIDQKTLETPPYKRRRKRHRGEDAVIRLERAGLKEQRHRRDIVDVLLRPKDAVLHRLRRVTGKIAELVD
jgi:hypothetical protein